MTATGETIPAQSQDRKPALESEMKPQPQYDRSDSRQFIASYPYY
jgi:hypothetical protein